MNNRMHHSICSTILLMGLVAFQLANAAPPVRVTSADPPFGNQDSTVTVSIFGRNFDTGEGQISAVKFLLPTCDPDDESCTPPDPNDPTGGVKATVIAVPSSQEIVATVVIDKSAVVEFRDIEVLMTGGRGGKGATLFKVEP